LFYSGKQNAAKSQNKQQQQSRLNFTDNKKANKLELQKLSLTIKEFLRFKKIFND